MRSKLTCFLLLLLPLFGLGQGQQVTNLAGFDISVSNFIVTSSIGEPAIMTFTNSNIILTQGFLQPEILPCKDLSPGVYFIKILLTNGESKTIKIVKVGTYE